MYFKKFHVNVYFFAESAFFRRLYSTKSKHALIHLMSVCFSFLSVSFFYHCPSMYLHVSLNINQSFMCHSAYQSFSLWSCLSLLFLSFILSPSLSSALSFSLSLSLSVPILNSFIYSKHYFTLTSLCPLPLLSPPSPVFLILLFLI
jgi:hypothetical protein